MLDCKNDEVRRMDSLESKGNSVGAEKRKVKCQREKVKRRKLTGG